MIDFTKIPVSFLRYKDNGFPILSVKPYKNNKLNVTCLSEDGEDSDGSINNIDGTNSINSSLDLIFDEAGYEMHLLLSNK